MQLYRRKCIRQARFEGDEATTVLEEGKQYVTTPIGDEGKVTVLAGQWLSGVPAAIFGEASPLTAESGEFLPRSLIITSG